MTPDTVVIMMGILALTVMVSVGIGRLSTNDPREQVSTSWKVFFFSWFIAIAVGLFVVYVVNSSS